MFCLYIMVAFFFFFFNIWLVPIQTGLIKGLGFCHYHWFHFSAQLCIFFSDHQSQLYQSRWAVQQHLIQNDYLKPFSISWRKKKIITTEEGNSFDIRFSAISHILIFVWWPARLDPISGFVLKKMNKIDWCFFFLVLHLHNAVFGWNMVRWFIHSINSDLVFGGYHGLK